MTVKLVFVPRLSSSATTRDTFYPVFQPRPWHASHTQACLTVKGHFSMPVWGLQLLNLRVCWYEPTLTTGRAVGVGL